MIEPQVVIFQHVDWEKPGRIAMALEEASIKYSVMNVADTKKPDLPDLDSVCGVVIMGGPMGAQDFDEYPGLKAEAKYAKAAIEAGTPVLGVCLGHQILATALGAKLSSNKENEIGFAQINRVERDEYLPLPHTGATPLHWHGDVVSLPKGAMLLAGTKLTKNQAFRYKTALGLQFHMEVNAVLLDEWLSTKEMTAGLKKSHIAKIREDFEKYNAQIRPLAEATFGGFAARCATYSHTLNN